MIVLINSVPQEPQFFRLHSSMLSAIQTGSLEFLSYLWRTVIKYTPLLKVFGSTLPLVYFLLQLFYLHMMEMLWQFVIMEMIVLSLLTNVTCRFEKSILHYNSECEHTTYSPTQKFRFVFDPWVYMWPLTSCTLISFSTLYC